MQVVGSGQGPVPGCPQEKQLVTQYRSVLLGVGLTRAG
jgi:hypothetical protein